MFLELVAALALANAPMQTIEQPANVAKRLFISVLRCPAQRRHGFPMRKSVAIPDIQSRIGTEKRTPGTGPAFEEEKLVG
jgi:hypothetical protein